MQTEKSIDKNNILGNVSLKRKVILTVLSFLFSVFSVIGYQIDRFASVKYPLISVLLILLSTVLFFIVLLPLFSLFDKVDEGRIAKYGLFNGKDSKFSKFLSEKSLLLFFITFIALGVFYFIQFLGLYPGLFVFDSRSQYLSFLNNNMSEFHPLLHTVLLGTIIKAVSDDPYSVNHGVALFVGLQLLLCIAAFSYIISFVAKRTKSIVLYILSVLFFGLYAPIVWESFSVTKDTDFMIFFVFSLLLSIEFLEDEKKFFKGFYKPVLLGICIALMSIFRNNCIYAIPFLFVFLFIFVKKHKHLVLPVLFVFLLIFIGYKLFFVPAFSNYKPDGREMYSVPFEQLMRVYTDDETVLSEADRQLIENIVPEEGRKYLPHIADGPKSVADMNYLKDNKTEVTKMYLRVFKDNPKEFIEAFLSLNVGFWYPACELTLYPDGSRGYWPITCFEPAVSNPKIPFILSFYQALEASDFMRTIPVSSYLFAPGTFFWIFLLFFAYALDRKKYTFLPMFGFSFIYLLTFLLGPVALVRYVIFFFVLLPIYFIVFAERKN